MRGVSGFRACVLSPSWATPETLRHWRRRIRASYTFLLRPLSTRVCKPLSYPQCIACLDSCRVSSLVTSAPYALPSPGSQETRRCLCSWIIPLDGRVPRHHSFVTFPMESYNNFLYIQKLTTVNNKNLDRRKCEYFKSKEYVFIEQSWSGNNLVSICLSCNSLNIRPLQNSLSLISFVAIFQ